MLKCSLGVRETLLIHFQSIGLNYFKWLGGWPSIDANKTLIKSTSRGGLQFGSSIYITIEGEVVGLMAHPLLLPFTNLIMKRLQNKHHEYIQCLECL